MITRRLVLVGASASALGACAAFDKNFQTALQDVDAIAHAAKGILVELGDLNIPGITPALVAKVGEYVAGIQAVAASLSTAVTQAQAQPLVQAVETYVNAIVQTLAGLPLPEPIATALKAAMVLLPIIEAAVGLVVKPAASIVMTPDDARYALRRVAI